LGPDFDIADFPMADAEINVELADGKTIVVHNAKVVAVRHADKIVLLFEGMTDDEQAVLDLL
jgi:septum formation inhibitor-activating ATPase MinD